MKICIVVDDYMPHSTKIAAKMMHDLAHEFIKYGHKVSVITPRHEIEKNIEKMKLDGVDIYFFKSGKIKNTNKIKRAINETLLSYRAWFTLKEFFRDNPHDYIIYYSPTIFWGPLIVKLKSLWNVKSYLILRDFFPQWAIDNGLIKKDSIIEKYFRYFEQINYKAADVIGVMSPNNLKIFKDYNKNLNVSSEVLYNWSNISTVKPIGKYRRKLQLENKIIFFYGGNMGHAQDMMNIIKLAQNMQNETKAHFLLVGSGDEVELIKKEIKRKNMKNITLLPPVPQEEFTYMMAECDIGLFTLNKNHKTHNFPGKLLGYMTQGLPILGSINEGNDLIDIIDKKAGLISITGEDKVLYENAMKLLNDPKYRLELGQSGKALLQSIFSTESAYKTIMKHISNI